MAVRHGAAEAQSTRLCHIWRSHEQENQVPLCCSGAPDATRVLLCAGIVLVRRIPGGDEGQARGRLNWHRGGAQLWPLSRLVGEFRPEVDLRLVGPRWPCEFGASNDLQRPLDTTRGDGWTCMSQSAPFGSRGGTFCRYGLQRIALLHYSNTALCPPPCPVHLSCCGHDQTQASAPALSRQYLFELPVVERSDHRLDVPHVIHSKLRCLGNTSTPWSQDAWSVG